MSFTLPGIARSDSSEPVMKKVRTTNWSAEAGNTEQAPCIWLDLLPPEVTQKIAATVSGGKRNTDALRLAQASANQC